MIDCSTLNLCALRTSNPLVIRPEPYVGVEATVMSSTGGTTICGQNSLKYQLFLGMDATLVVPKFGFTVWSYKIEFGGSMLPRIFSMPVTDKVGLH